MTFDELELLLAYVDAKTEAVRREAKGETACKEVYEAIEELPTKLWNLATES
jgi:hypothetical protein